MDNKFSRSINNIDDSIFNKYYNYEEKLKAQKAIKIRKRNKFIALAACLTFCVCVSVALILPALKSTEPTIEPDNVLGVITDNQLSRPEDNTGEADTTEEYVTSIDTSEDTVIEGETTTVETQNTHPYEIRVDDNMVFIKDESGCYVVIDDLYKYSSNSSHSGMQLAYIPFETMKDFKDTITKCLLSDSDKELIAWAVRVYSNNKTSDLRKRHHRRFLEPCGLLRGIFCERQYPSFDRTVRKL